MVASRKDEGAKLLQVVAPQGSGGGGGGVVVGGGGYRGHSTLHNNTSPGEAMFVPTSVLKKSRRSRSTDTDTSANKGHISFYPGVAVRECLHINDFTEEEIVLSWYRRNDFTRIKQSFQIIIQRVSSGTWEGDTDHETARGLEFRNRNGAMKRKANKLNGLMAVLDEQERQWSLGFHDDEAIADAYIAVSLKCSFAARMIASKDESDMRTFWVDDNDWITQKMSNVSVDSTGKRSLSPAHCEDGTKKTRLKQFIKKIHYAQQATAAMSSGLKKAPPE